MSTDQLKPGEFYVDTGEQMMPDGLKRCIQDRLEAVFKPYIGRKLTDELVAELGAEVDAVRKEFQT
jgi:hypothetical protein